MAKRQLRACIFHQQGFARDADSPNSYLCQIFTARCTEKDNKELLRTPSLSAYLH